METPALSVRPLQPPDVPAYRVLMLEGYAHDADAFTTTAAERAAEPAHWWQARVCDPDGGSQAFGAFLADRLVGAVAVECNRKFKVRHRAVVVGMYVLPAHRGAGAGRALLDAALTHARARRGIEVVTLTVTHGNDPAVRLYESAGFQSFGLEPMAIFTGTEFKCKLHMQLRLRT
jgi:ribosomal protein S18 acetylase RimI-like enzyme